MLLTQYREYKPEFDEKIALNKEKNEAMKKESLSKLMHDMNINE